MNPEPDGHFPVKLVLFGLAVTLALQPVPAPREEKSMKDHQVLVVKRPAHHVQLLHAESSTGTSSAALLWANVAFVATDSGSGTA
jgi:hypothetical protein